MPSFVSLVCCWYLCVFATWLSLASVLPQIPSAKLRYQLAFEANTEADESVDTAPEMKKGLLNEGMGPKSSHNIAPLMRNGPELYVKLVGYFVKVSNAHHLSRSRVWTGNAWACNMSATVAWTVPITTMRMCCSAQQVRKPKPCWGEMWAEYVQRIARQSTRPRTSCSACWRSTATPCSCRCSASRPSNTLHGRAGWSEWPTSSRVSLLGSRPSSKNKPKVSPTVWSLGEALNLTARETERLRAAVELVAGGDDGHALHMPKGAASMLRMYFNKLIADGFLKARRASRWRDCRFLCFVEINRSYSQIYTRG